jgi:poly-gamma-glutamate capsule biosynthesis protein CapA/YwtB (metallophosphatase superfamily)
MTWERGRTEIERLLAAGELERVGASPEVAERLLADAEAHIRLAAKGTRDDPAGALQLGYDAARKAAALLATQGLRATTRGGHIAVIDAARAQFSDKGGMPVFGRINRLRRRRHDSEYPSDDTPAIATDDADRALTIAGEAVDAARNIIATGRLGPFN